MAEFESFIQFCLLRQIRRVGDYSDVNPRIRMIFCSHIYYKLGAVWLYVVLTIGHMHTCKPYINLS